MASFNAQFTRLASLEEVAHEINLPHDDYPMRVDKTHEILLAVSTALALGEERVIASFVARSIHSDVMWDLKSRGSYRTVNVRINDYRAPDFLQVPHLMEPLFPVGQMSDAELKAWYEKFQTVHPFEDGNGRVGGIIVAVLSFDGKTYMAPGQ